jgi:isopenicillin-N epimerase
MQHPSSHADAQHWILDPTVVFLNHGAFGACPTPVLAQQLILRSRLEQEPVRFFAREYEPLLDEARQHLATFVGVHPQDLVFVPNATTGVNSVLRSLTFAAGDELLTTNHSYNACRNALHYVAERSGAAVVTAQIPFPIHSSQQVLDAILSCVTSHTRLLLIDHITSPTALIFPIQELASHLVPQGIEILVDGAHSPGMIPLDIQALGVTYYAGNCHKWLCAPKGAGFLYVQRDRHSQIHPLTISHGTNDPRPQRSRFQLEFDWTGTQDPTAYLAIPTAIEFMDSLVPGGWTALRKRNHQLALAARQLLAEALNPTTPLCPAEMLGSMATLPLPPAFGVPKTLPDSLIDELQEQLWEQFHIEVPIIPWRSPAGENKLIRVCAQLYNSLEQYQYLADCLQKCQNSSGLAEK